MKREDKEAFFKVIHYYVEESQRLRDEKEELEKEKEKLNKYLNEIEELINKFPNAAGFVLRDFFKREIKKG